MPTWRTPQDVEISKVVGRVVSLVGSHGARSVPKLFDEAINGRDQLGLVIGIIVLDVVVEHQAWVILCQLHGPAKLIGFPQLSAVDGSCIGIMEGNNALANDINTVEP
jgi:hypothetical protein